MKGLRLIAVAAFLLVIPLMAFPQQAVGAYEDIFREFFPSPTGQNGYEELVKAGDVIKESALWKTMEPRMGELTLAEQRQLMSDPAVRRALDLMRLGIRKPVITPHKNGDDETRFPELSRFRSVARLLSIEMYVQLADGKVSQAIDTLADTLRFGY